MTFPDPRFRLEHDDLLVFVHIPKTAGTSMRHILRANRPVNRGATCQTAGAPEELRTGGQQLGQETFAASMRALASIPPEDLAGRHLIFGHYFYSFLTQFLPRQAIYLTFLRDPIERALSNYSHVQRHANITHHLWGPDTDLEAFTFHPLVANGTMLNLQSRMLGAVWDFDDLNGALAALADEDRSASQGKCASAAAAIAALDEMAYFGLAERFEESLALLAYTFGWAAPPHTPRLNVAPQRPARERLPQHLRERLVALNQEDITLYRYALQVFEARIARMTADLGMPEVTSSSERTGQSDA